MEAEYGRARGTERYRLVISSVVHLPWQLTAAPILEYGSGQPWTERLGYDFNGDGKNSDRPLGVGRNTMHGPKFRQVSLRLTKAIPAGGFGQLDVIAEAFNVTNFKNFDVTSVSAGQFLSGPTITNPNAVAVKNTAFGTYSQTLSPREVQLGLRLVF